MGSNAHPHPNHDMPRQSRADLSCCCQPRLRQARYFLSLIRFSRIVKKSTRWIDSTYPWSKGNLLISLEQKVKFLFSRWTMRSQGRSSLTAYAFESLLDRIACLDPSGFVHQDVIEDDYNKKKRYSSDSRSNRSGRDDSKNSRHSRRLPPVSTPRPTSGSRRSTKGRLQVCKYTPTVTSTINTASESDATPWSRSKKSWSSSYNSSERSSSFSRSSSASSSERSSSESSESRSEDSEDEDYDDKINLVIQVKRDCEEEQLQQPKKPKRKPETSAAAKEVPAPPPRPSRKSWGFRSQPKPAKSQRSKDPETSVLKKKELWKGKTVNASRRLGPF